MEGLHWSSPHITRELTGFEVSVTKKHCMLTEETRKHVVLPILKDTFLPIARVPILIPHPLSMRCKIVQDTICGSVFICPRRESTVNTASKTTRHEHFKS